jgi:hypothetical protein
MSTTGLPLNIQVTVEAAERIAKQARDAYRTGLMGKVFWFFSGRHTFFAIAILTLGTILAFMGKLTSQYVALMSVVQGLVLAHSWKEDSHEETMAGK